VRRLVALVMVHACTLGLAVASPGVAQRAARAPGTQLTTELGRIRDAATFEAAGNYADAEKVIQQVLEANPQSLSGLLTMERLLAAQNRLPEIMPAVDRLLAADPVSVIGHQLRLRVVSTANDDSRLDSAGTEWIRAVPHLETPYREIAAVWRARNEHARAVAVLEQGRRRIDRPDALALELGDAYLGLREHRRAAEEWSRAVGPDGRGFILVQRRLQSLPDGGAAVIPQLVDRLTQKPVAFSRLRAAAMLAVDAGLEHAVTRLLPDLAASAPQAEREPLLVELARRADGAGLHGVALSSYRELLGSDRESASSLAVRSRIAELALLTGDTALATRTYAELERAAAVGSPQRRQAVALRIQLTAREGELHAAIADLDAFRNEYPQAPELDATAALVATRLVDAGAFPEAERVLSGVHGARSALARGRIFLRQGDITRAREELVTAAPHLRGAEATETIALASLLGRLSARGGELVTLFVASAPAERSDRLRATADAARALPISERAAILDFLAATADAAGADVDAIALRREIADDMPRSQEAPAALLALARAARAREQGDDEARLLLERLIVEYPRSALAPQARAELQQSQYR
jgi:hypothetical protein